MNENISFKILNSYTEIEKMTDNINNKIWDFVTEANKLVEMSEDNYQIERTFKLNKISLKGYVLDSDCCLNLKKKNIALYSIDELKNYLRQYENTFNTDCSKYFLSLAIYESIEEIERLIDEKVNFEQQILSKLIPNIKDINQKKDEQCYFEIKEQLNEYSKANNFDEKTYNVSLRIMNDIFNYYINGYPTIPDEYLYRE